MTTSNQKWKYIAIGVVTGIVATLAAEFGYFLWVASVLSGH